MRLFEIFQFPESKEEKDTRIDHALDVARKIGAEESELYSKRIREIADAQIQEWHRQTTIEELELSLESGFLWTEPITYNMTWLLAGDYPAQEMRKQTVKNRLSVNFDYNAILVVKLPSSLRADRVIPFQEGAVSLPSIGDETIPEAVLRSKNKLPKFLTDPTFEKDRKIAALDIRHLDVSTTIDLTQKLLEKHRANEEIKLRFQENADQLRTKIKEWPERENPGVGARASMKSPAWLQKMIDWLRPRNESKPDETLTIQNDTKATTQADLEAIKAKLWAVLLKHMYFFQLREDQKKIEFVYHRIPRLGVFDKQILIAIEHNAVKKLIDIYLKRLKDLNEPSFDINTQNKFIKDFDRETYDKVLSRAYFQMQQVYKDTVERVIKDPDIDIEKDFYAASTKAPFDIPSPQIVMPLYVSAEDIHLINSIVEGKEERAGDITPHRAPSGAPRVDERILNAMQETGYDKDVIHTATIVGLGSNIDEIKEMLENFPNLNQINVIALRLKREENYGKYESPEGLQSESLRFEETWLYDLKNYLEKERKSNVIVKIFVAPAGALPHELKQNKSQFVSSHNLLDTKYVSMKYVEKVYSEIAKIMDANSLLLVGGGLHEMPDVVEATPFKLVKEMEERSDRDPQSLYAVGARLAEKNTTGVSRRQILKNGSAALVGALLPQTSSKLEMTHNGERKEIEIIREYGTPKVVKKSSDSVLLTKEETIDGKISGPANVKLDFATPLSVSSTSKPILKFTLTPNREGMRVLFSFPVGLYMSESIELTKDTQIEIRFSEAKIIVTKPNGQKQEIRLGSVRGEEIQSMSLHFGQERDGGLDQNQITDEVTLSQIEFKSGARASGTRLSSLEESLSKYDSFVSILPLHIEEFLDKSPFQEPVKTGMDIVGIFDMHAYAERFSAVEPAIQRAIDIGKRQNRPIIFILEDDRSPAQTVSQFMQKGFQTWSKLEAYFKNIKSDIENLMGQHNKTTLEMLQQKKEIVDSLASASSPSMKYRLTLQNFIQNLDIHLALEQWSFSSWWPGALASLESIKMQVFAQTGRAEDAKKAAKARAIYLMEHWRMRDEMMTAHQLPRLAQKYPGGIVIILRGTNHHQMLEGLDPKIFRRLIAIGDLARPDTIEPSEWLAYRMLVRPHARDMEELEDRYLGFSQNYVLIQGEAIKQSNANGYLSFTSEEMIKAINDFSMEDLVPDSLTLKPSLNVLEWEGSKEIAPTNLTRASEILGLEEGQLSQEVLDKIMNIIRRTLPNDKPESKNKKKKELQEYLGAKNISCDNLKAGLLLEVFSSGARAADTQTRSSTQYFQKVGRTNNLDSTERMKRQNIQITRDYVFHMTGQSALKDTIIFKVPAGLNLTQGSDNDAVSLNESQKFHDFAFRHQRFEGWAGQNFLGVPSRKVSESPGGIKVSGQTVAGVSIPRVPSVLDGSRGQVSRPNEALPLSSGASKADSQALPPALVATSSSLFASNSSASNDTSFSLDRQANAGARLTKLNTHLQTDIPHLPETYNAKLVSSPIKDALELNQDPESLILLGMLFLKSEKSSLKRQEYYNFLLSKLLAIGTFRFLPDSNRESVRLEVLQSDGTKAVITLNEEILKQASERLAERYRSGVSLVKKLKGISLTDIETDDYKSSLEYTVKKIIALVATDAYQKGVPVIFHYHPSSNLPQDHEFIQALKEMVARGGYIQELMGGYIGFELPDKEGKFPDTIHEAQVVDLGALNQALLDRAIGHGVSAVSANTSTDYTAPLIQMMLLAIAIQRLDKATPELRQAWRNAHPDVPLELIENNSFFDLSKKVSSDPAKRTKAIYEPLSFNLVHMLWQKLLQISTQELAVGVSA